MARSKNHRFHFAAIINIAPYTIKYIRNRAVMMMGAIIFFL